jgi:hypothetical protein
MSDSAKVSITLKAGPGFEVPWIVLYGDTIAEAVALLQEAGTTPIATLAANAARSFQAEYAASGLGTTQVSTFAPQTTPNAVQPTAPAPTQTNAPAAGAETIADRYQNQWTYNSPGAPLCAHGVAYAVKAGTSKAGKSYRGWFCTKGGPKPVSLQGNTCDASFDNVPR